MINKEDSFLVGRIKSVKYAFKGLFRLILKEHSVITQLTLFFFISCAGFYFGISKTEWMFQIIAFTLVLVAEGLNTAIEEIANFVHPDYHKKIGTIKDIAAGSVTFAAIGAFVLLAIIYTPKFL